jgi:hypothetical protein
MRHSAFLPIARRGVCLLGAASALAAGTVDLAGPRIAVTLQDGHLREVVNRQTSRRDALRDEGVLLVFDGFEVDLGPAAFTTVRTGPEECRFRWEGKGIEAELVYRLKAGQAWVERTLTLTNRRPEAVVLKRAVDGRLRFARPFQSFLVHDDNLTEDPAGDGNREVDGHYRTALNVFLRQGEGGLFAGLAYPYWTPWITSDALDLGWEPNTRLASGESLELPPFFLGTYRATGTVCRKELWWRPRLVDTGEHAMDWGEVRAMQELMKDHLPLCPMPAPGYYLWLNSWWAVLGTPEEQAMQGPITADLVPAWKRLIDQVASCPAVDALNTAPVWVGLAGYLGGPDTLASVGEDARFPMNEPIRAVLAHAREKGVPLLGFAEPNGRVYRADRPGWAVQPTEDPALRLRTRCHANPAYETWFLRLVEDTLDRTGIVGWAWDYHWMRRPAFCFDPGHGHEPGNTEFQQYRQITSAIQELRKRHPSLFLEIYWGLKEGGSWAHRGLNSLENVYENGNVAPPGLSRADDQRFQAWFNQNYRFLPTYLNLAQINFEGNETNGFTYSMLSALQGSRHGQLNEWPSFADGDRTRAKLEELAAWKRWAGEHLDFLGDRITLFGMPCRKDGIDGSAHIRGDRGYLFVFNPWPGPARWGSIPLDAMIGLQGSGPYRIDEISSRQPRPMGVVRGGDAFVFSVPPRGALLFELRPTREAPTPAPVPPRDAVVQPAFTR